VGLKMTHKQRVVVAAWTRSGQHSKWKVQRRMNALLQHSGQLQQLLGKLRNRYPTHKIGSKIVPGGTGQAYTVLVHGYDDL